MYTLHAIRKSYGGIPVLKDITIRIPSDRFVFIMGPSGSGKSTLLRLLSFVELPDAGYIELDLKGSFFSSSKRDRPWPRLTAVFQKQFLWPHLTLRQNISLPLRASGVTNIEERLENALRLFDMATFIDRYPNEVSGGQASRAALARALVLQPDLVLIDEAHGGLDLEQQKVVNDHFLMLRGIGVGLIVVTHSLDFARRYADSIIVLEEGAVTESGGSEILDQPRSSFLKRVLSI
jgi:ABC-type Fe3+/spermidine/putrescine transport system ATPase subunit